MASTTSTSTRSLPIVNDRCVLRRNLRTQPYGRCTVCTLRLPECHAWQSSALSFLLVVAALAVTLVPAGWPLQAVVLLMLALIVVQGIANHRRTDELIYRAHELQRASDLLHEQNEIVEGARRNLETAVEARTAELREANRALARANLEAMATACRRQQMVVDISHELRTPLTSVQGAAQNLLDGVSGPLTTDQREYIEIVRDHARRLSAAADGIIEAARGMDAPVQIDPAPVDLAELAAEVARGLMPVARERGISLDLRASPMRVDADGDKLRTIIENLLSNALKFTDAGGSVTVEVARVPDGASLRVRDTGIGIKRDQRARIFQRYYRAHERRPGTGVGLAIARDLVHLHGGRLTVESAPGRGSEFVVTIPDGAA
jgi:signal transduction histidine kinase